MYSIIVVPAPTTVDGFQRPSPARRFKLAPGDVLPFGRSAPEHGGPHLTIEHDGVAHAAGEITAGSAFRTLSNLSTNQTYVVENPEGAGEHIKVAPGRLDAPVPFEFSRVALPAAGELIGFEVWAPHHDRMAPHHDRWAPHHGRGAPLHGRRVPLHDRSGGDSASASTAGRRTRGPADAIANGSAEGTADGTARGSAAASPFALDTSTRYFAVPAALCEPRLRGAPHAPLPTVDQVVERLRPVWPAANRATVRWSVDHLAVKLRLRPGRSPDGRARRLNGKKESLVSLALRFDLVREDDLSVPTTERAEGRFPDRTAGKRPSSDS
ncbi:FHA domain-containing protein [Streptomyces sp. DT24]|uniref:FHA domain-containing protein n=1 Tax=Streptomyces sp. DT24 TaxID=3416520 RepID=UPI003CF12C57